MRASVLGLGDVVPADACALDATGQRLLAVPAEIRLTVQLALVGLLSGCLVLARPDLGRSRSAAATAAGMSAIGVSLAGKRARATSTSSVNAQSGSMSTK